MTHGIRTKGKQVQTHTVRKLIPLFNPVLSDLGDKIRAEDSAAALAKRQKMTKKSKVINGVSDEMVLEMRALRDYAHWVPRRIAARYNVDIHWLYKILNYETRSKLIPKAINLPADR
jgi:hypothetical protein